MAGHSVQVWTCTGGGHTVYTRHHRLAYDPFLSLAVCGRTDIRVLAQQLSHCAQAFSGACVCQALS